MFPSTLAKQVMLLHLNLLPPTFPTLNRVTQHSAFLPWRLSRHPNHLNCGKAIYFPTLFISGCGILCTEVFGCSLRGYWARPS